MAQQIYDEDDLSSITEFGPFALKSTLNVNNHLISPVQAGVKFTRQQTGSESDSSAVFIVVSCLTSGFDLLIPVGTPWIIDGLLNFGLIIPATALVTEVKVTFDFSVVSNNEVNASDPTFNIYCYPNFRLKAGDMSDGENPYIEEQFLTVLSSQPTQQIININEVGQAEIIIPLNNDLPYLIANFSNPFIRFEIGIENQSRNNVAGTVEASSDYDLQISNWQLRVTYADPDEPDIEVTGGPSIELTGAVNPETIGGPTLGISAEGFAGTNQAIGGPSMGMSGGGLYGWNEFYAGPNLNINGAAVKVLSVDVSGLYTFVKDKRNDTLYTRNEADDTLDVKIPKPFGKTALFGG